MSELQDPRDLFPIRPDEGEATTDEVFKCWNCGTLYPTEGESEGQCPVCGERCTAEICAVTYTSNEGF